MALTDMLTRGALPADAPLDLLNTISLGDCRELGERVPDASLDGIWTDPPYDDASMWVWPWLGDWAARKLVPGGLLFTYVGKHALPQVVLGLGSGGLQYFWEFAAIQLNSNQRYFARHLISVFRPILAYVKPRLDGKMPPCLHWVVDGRKALRDKAYHDWGQGANVPQYYIDRLTSTDAMLADPFAGGGQMPAVFKALGRRFYAFEIAPDKVATGLARLGKIMPGVALPPVFGPEDDPSQIIIVYDEPPEGKPSKSKTRRPRATKPAPPVA